MTGEVIQTTDLGRALITGKSKFPYRGLEFSPRKRDPCRTQPVAVVASVPRSMPQLGAFDAVKKSGDRSGPAVDAVPANCSRT